MPSRYDCVSTELSNVISNETANEVVVVEVGVYAGDRAVRMIQQIQKSKKIARYFGFDLFEELTLEKNREERGKAKLPPSRKAVLQRLLGVYTGPSERAPQLVAGDSTKTLPQIHSQLAWADLIFIDGGHSLETIASDWEAIRSLMHAGTVVLLDDCYPGDRTVGCLKLAEELSADPALKVEFLQPIDHYPNLSVQMVKVTHAPA